MSSVISVLGHFFTVMDELNARLASMMIVADAWLRLQIMTCFGNRLATSANRATGSAPIALART